MNEGDAPYLRARAKKYRQVARETGDKAASDELNRIAAEYEKDARSIVDHQDNQAEPERSGSEARRNQG